METHTVCGLALGCIRLTELAPTELVETRAIVTLVAPVDGAFMAMPLLTAPTPPKLSHPDTLAKQGLDDAATHRLSPHTWPHLLHKLLSDTQRVPTLLLLPPAVRGLQLHTPTLRADIVTLAAPVLGPFVTVAPLTMMQSALTARLNVERPPFAVARRLHTPPTRGPAWHEMLLDDLQLVWQPAHLPTRDFKLVSTVLTDTTASVMLCDPVMCEFVRETLETPREYPS